MNGRGRRASRPALTYPGSGLMAIGRDTTRRVDRLVLGEGQSALAFGDFLPSARVSAVRLNNQGAWNVCAHRRVRDDCVDPRRASGRVDAMLPGYCGPLGRAA